MTRSVDKTRMLAQLGAEQRIKLMENDHKGGWSHESPMQLLKLLEAEFTELCEAVMAADWTDPSCVRAVKRECADISNFSGFILDNAINKWGK